MAFLSWGPDLRPRKFQLAGKKAPAFFFFVCLILLAGFFAGWPTVSRQFSACPNITAQHFVVRGRSMEPLVKPGEEIVAWRGYYDCYSVEKGDLVLVRVAGRKEPLLKIVKAVPGDRFFLKKEQNNWHLFVNGELQKNSENQPYVFGLRRAKLLSLYKKDYGGVIPAGAYLILGNSPAGSMDSSRFGLVGKEQIVAKVKK